MEWIPVVLLTFKVLVLAIGMYFAIKWHYDRGNRNGGTTVQRRAVLRASGVASAVFVFGVIGLVYLTFFLSSMLGVNMTMP